MSDPGDAPDAFADAMIAARLCAFDPLGLGGMILRGGGERRDAVVAALRAAFPRDAPVRRMPPHIDDAALLGGLDLAATLASGAAVRRAGLLAEAAGGVVIVPMAERLPDGTAARIAAAIDAGARFALVMLDDGIEAEERAPFVLLERMAFHLDLSDAPYPPTLRAVADETPVRGKVAPPTEDALRALSATALALGVDSARAPLFALRAARAAAAIAGRDSIDEEDLTLAARLVLGPRATRLPAPEEASDDTAPPPPRPEGEDGEQNRGTPEQLDDVVLAATLASLPKDVLAQLADGPARRGATDRARGRGERRRSAQRGRPLAARAGLPRGGARLSLIDTLRAAAPWQKLRGNGPDKGGIRRVEVRRDDLRVRRFETRAEALTIFAVDASGSAALTRLAEAKGAVELLLAEAYVKRAQVALVAFRGVAAELLLPPTRSLARARRSLAELPGGGGTPLAAGLNAARELAEVARARGRTPFVVILTDGRANIAADGGMARKAAEEDAAAAAQAFGATGVGAAFIDISPRPRPEGATLAAAMGARYLPLPRADAATMHAAVVAAQRG